MTGTQLRFACSARLHIWLWVGRREKAKGIIEELLDKHAESVISATKEEREGKVLERRAVPNSQDLLGRYEIQTKTNLCLVKVFACKKVCNGVAGI